MENVTSQKSNSFLPAWTVKIGSQVKPKTYFNTLQPSSGLLKTPTDRRSRPKSKKRKSLSERLATYYQTKKKLSTLYFELGNEKKADRIAKCGRFVEIAYCENGHIAHKKVNYFCKHRLCPECSSITAYERVLEFEPIVNAFLTSRPELTPLHLVLTQLQKPNETLKQARQRLMKAVKKLIENKFWNDSFAGSLNAYEFTISHRVYSNGAVHYHLHMMAFCKISDSQRNKEWLEQFRDEWSKVSNGENKNLKIVPITDVKSGLKELLKYVCAPQDIQQFTVEHLREVEELHRCKMHSTFGDFLTFVADYRAKEKEVEKEPVEKKTELKAGDPCPTCQKALIVRQMPIETAIIHIRELETITEMRI
jgi:plasmid rolling circle replication initiator protein Rep